MPWQAASVRVRSQYRADQPRTARKSGQHRNLSVTTHFAAWNLSNRGEDGFCRCRGRRMWRATFHIRSSIGKTAFKSLNPNSEVLSFICTVDALGRLGDEYERHC